MSLLSILFIAVALAADAFAASVTFGLTKKIKLKKALLISSFFGLFQGGMAFLGWFFCLFFRTAISAFDHWIAFILLIIIAFNMILQAKQPHSNVYSTDLGSISLVSLATSIDALAAGVSLSVLSVAIVKPSILIGSVAFFLTLLGIYLGKKLRGYIHNESILYYIAGMILILIAVKIMLDHTLH
jgi:putative Mn2+ efflux pump MntP